MKKTLMALMIPLSIFCFVSAAAWAGPSEKSSKMEKETSMMEEMRKDKSMTEEMSGEAFPTSQRISQVIGSEVINKEGALLGRIDDVIVDENGRLSYLVLARGGMLGIGTKLVAIPVSAVPPRIANDGKFLIDVDLAMLDAAPTFTAANFPDFSDRRWQEEARGYFGGSKMGTPAREEKSPTGY